MNPFWLGLGVGMIIGLIFNMLGTYSYKNTLKMIGDTRGSEKILGKWYQILPEGTIFNLSTKQIRRILEWKREYTYQVGSYIEDNEVERKLKEYIREEE